MTAATLLGVIGSVVAGAAAGGITANVRISRIVSGSQQAHTAVAAAEHGRNTFGSGTARMDSSPDAAVANVAISSGSGDAAGRDIHK